MIVGIVIQEWTFVGWFAVIEIDILFDHIKYGTEWLTIVNSDWVSSEQLYSRQQDCVDQVLALTICTEVDYQDKLKHVQLLLVQKLLIMLLRKDLMDKLH